MQRFRVNNQIYARKVRVIDNSGKNLGIIDLRTALSIAYKKGLDLVQVGKDKNFPVCKIVNYKKFLYQLKKKHKKQPKIKLKMVKIGFKTSEHDLKIKANKITKFLEKNNPVKIQLLMRGRENKMKDLARQKIEELLKYVAVDYKIESNFKFSGNTLNIVIIKK